MLILIIPLIVWTSFSAVPFVTYRFSVQAHTGVGPGNFSAPQFFETDPTG